MNASEDIRIHEVYSEYERIEKWKYEGPGRELMLEERSDCLQHLMSNEFGRPLEGCRIIDIGCGNGELLGWFLGRGAKAENLFGVDLFEPYLETARRKYPSFHFAKMNAEALDFPESSFDIVAAYTVFSSILDDSVAHNVARSIGRILKTDGVFVWYDMRYPNPRNRNVRAMTKPMIRELFPDFDVDLRPVTLVPPLADALGGSALLYHALASVPMLRSHYMGLLRKRASRP